MGTATVTEEAGVSWHKDIELWWPKYDYVTKDYHYMMKHAPDVDHTVRLCKQRRTVIQAGSHVGIWPRRLAKYFKRVFTFEVNPLNQECCKRNCAGFQNIICGEVGLGPTEMVAPLLPTTSLGGWKIDPEGPLQTQLITIDSLKLTDCDAIVLDIEQYEVPALMGAQETIARCKPVIHVEELLKTGSATKDYMTSIGYKEVHRVSKDGIYVPI